MEPSTFVDPRSSPRPSPSTPPPRTTTDPTALADLHHHCRDGRLYEIEEWIRAGRPLQVAAGVTIKGRHSTSALEIGLETRNQAVVLLLLCNGYDPNLEACSMLDVALRARRRDLLELLLDWGADPQRVSLSDLFDTYQSDLFERFRTYGVDLTAGHALAEALAEHTSNKPLFGFAKRHWEHNPRIQQELNIALGHHAGEGNEKGVLLCLWAGADPHAPVPSLRYPGYSAEADDATDEEDRFLGFTAIEEACRAGNVRILERLGPDPLRDDFDELYEDAPNSAVIDLLARSALPRDLGRIIRAQVSRLRDDLFHQPRSVDVLRRLFETGARCEAATGEQLADIRRALLRLSDYTFVETMKLLATRDYCAASILEELGRTPTMRARMTKVGFIASPSENRWTYSQPRPTRAREVCVKFGVPLPKKVTWPLPLTVEVGSQHRDGREIRLTRAALFERVWSEPVERLAHAWGLSGRGLGKVCQRLQIPVPPRGYWAKAQHGRPTRRPLLPALPPGEAEEIVIRVATGDRDETKPERGGSG